MPLRSERGTANRGEKRKVRSKTNNVVTPKTGTAKPGESKLRPPGSAAPGTDSGRASITEYVPLFLQRSRGLSAEQINSDHQTESAIMPRERWLERRPTPEDIVREHFGPRGEKKDDRPRQETRPEG